VEKRQVYDAIVIGAGAAGCLAAKELTEGGLSVLLLDAGPEVDPIRDFPVPPPRDRGLLDRLTLALRGQHIQARCPPFNRTTRRFYVSDRLNPYTTPKGKPFNWFRGRQVGGRLHTWGRVVPRFSNWEFKPATYGAGGIDWPICYEDLEPFYERVERLVGVHGTLEGLPQIPDGVFIESRGLNPLEQHISAEIAARWPTRRFIPARVVRHTSLRTPVPLHAALQTGRLTVRANAVVRRIATDAHGARARGVAFVDRLACKPFEAEGRVIVVCASAIESVRLLLNSACERHRNGLGNSSGLLGHGVMDHCMVAVAGSVPETLFRAHEATAVDASRDPYDLASLYMYMPGFRNITERCSEFSGSYGILASAGRPDPTFFFLGLGEMLPYRENQISINPKVHDAWGIPAAHVECAHYQNERALIADMYKTMREIVAGGGLRVEEGFGLSRRGVRGLLYRYLADRLWTPYQALHPGSAIHELGGARMGDSPRSSVLNQYNQCWDVPNVFVTDGACFVSSGYQNSTLTIMALTVRACDFIVARCQKGDL
jgi:choline dehydrogenase-like flavoprotein